MLRTGWFQNSGLFFFLFFFWSRHSLEVARTCVACMEYLVWTVLLFCDCLHGLEVCPLSASKSRCGVQQGMGGAGGDTPEVSGVQSVTLPLLHCAPRRSARPRPAVCPQDSARAQPSSPFETLPGGPVATRPRGLALARTGPQRVRAGRRARGGQAESSQTPRGAPGTQEGGLAGGVRGGRLSRKGHPGGVQGQSQAQQLQGVGGPGVWTVPARAALTEQGKGGWMPGRGTDGRGSGLQWAGPWGALLGTCPSQPTAAASASRGRHG